MVNEDERANTTRNDRLPEISERQPVASDDSRFAVWSRELLDVDAGVFLTLDTVVVVVFVLLVVVVVECDGGGGGLCSLLSMKQIARIST